MLGQSVVSSKVVIVCLEDGRGGGKQGGKGEKEEEG